MEAWLHGWAGPGTGGLHPRGTLAGPGWCRVQPGTQAGTMGDMQLLLPDEGGWADLQQETVCFDELAAWHHTLHLGVEDASCWVHKHMFVGGTG